MCGALYTLTANISTAPKAGKDKEREAPRKASPHSKENPGETREMNLYHPQSQPGQAHQRTPTQAQRGHIKDVCCGLEYGSKELETWASPLKAMCK